jgi:hypothetical protein
MLVAAFVILAVAVLLGSVLAVLHLQTEGRATPPWRLAALHGLLAISGSVVSLWRCAGRHGGWITALHPLARLPLH